MQYIHITISWSDTSGAQNQYDIEMDLQVGNEYAEVGPQTFNSKGVEVAGTVGNAEVCSFQYQLNCTGKHLVIC